MVDQISPNQLGGIDLAGNKPDISWFQKPAGFGGLDVTKSDLLKFTDSISKELANRGAKISEAALLYFLENSGLVNPQ